MVAVEAKSAVATPDCLDKVALAVVAAKAMKEAATAEAAISALTDCFFVLILCLFYRLDCFLLLLVLYQKETP